MPNSQRGRSSIGMITRPHVVMRADMPSIIWHLRLIRQTHPPSNLTFPGAQCFVARRGRSASDPQRRQAGDGRSHLVESENGAGGKPAVGQLPSSLFNFESVHFSTLANRALRSYHPPFSGQTCEAGCRSRTQQRIEMERISMRTSQTPKTQRAPLIWFHQLIRVSCGTLRRQMNRPYE
jgi:hypothetical protein